MHIQHDGNDHADDTRPPWNRRRKGQNWVDQVIWNSSRHALRARHPRHRHGVPAASAVRRLAATARTAQSQSEIPEILAGRRVVAYDVLVPIAEGLGVPRGWMGLEYTYPDELGETPTVPGCASSSQLGAHVDQPSTGTEPG